MINLSQTTAQRRTRDGFTLIELLVVIGIISLLSTIVLASLNTARHKAHDAFRKQTMHSVEQALALYYADHGRYPWGTAYSAWMGRWEPYGCGKNWRNCDNLHGNPMQELVDGGYITDLPLDPDNHEDYLINGHPAAAGFYYCSGNPRGNCPQYPTNQTYVLGTNLEFTEAPNAWFGNYQLTNPQ